jgi:hypothetical protein
MKTLDEIKALKGVDRSLAYLEARREIEEAQKENRRVHKNESCVMNTKIRKLGLR